MEKILTQKKPFFEENTPYLTNSIHGFLPPRDRDFLYPLSTKGTALPTETQDNRDSRDEAALPTEFMEAGASEEKGDVLSRRRILSQGLRAYLQHQEDAWNWSKNARPEQKIPPGDWRIWLILAGRGFGKTRTGAETIRQWVAEKRYRRICLLGDHGDDVRKVMIEGESGLVSRCPPREGVLYEPSKQQLTWPCGALATGYSASAPQQLRGPQFDAAWIDELAKFERGQEAWDQLMMGLRLGPNPRVIITTTPRPSPLLKELLNRSDVFVTRGTTWDNEKNLPKSYIQMLKHRYAGTTLGAQELDGLVLENSHHGLWKPHMIVHEKPPEHLVRIVVAIDPAVSSHENSAETGIIVAGCDEAGKGYVLEDCSGRYSSTQWIHKAVEAYERHKADRIIAEVNNGGDLVQHLLYSLFPHVPYQAVYATRSKHLRAEPVAALYEQKRILHGDYFQELEQQMLQEKRPLSDRMDALVWALNALFFNPPAPKILIL